MIVLSQQILDYANGLLILCLFYLIFFFFNFILIELRQAARDLHRLQSKYEPIPTAATTTDANQSNNNIDHSSAEQTRYLFFK
jgi:hypothetical protein